MFNALGDIWNQQQQSLADQGIRPGQMDTAGIAGKLILSGVLPKDAYVQAAQIFHGQEQNNLQKQKQEQRQQQLVTASRILQQGGSLADLLAAGVDNPAILGALPQSQWVSNPHEPGGGSFRNPGARGMQQPGLGGGMGGSQNNMMPPQQEPQQMYDQAPSQDISTSNRIPMTSPGLGNETPAEKQANIDVQKKAQIEANKTDEKFEEEVRNSFAAAQDSKRLLKKLDKAYETYDKNAGRRLKPGSILANTTNLPFLNAGQTRAILHNDKTINQAAEINKIGTALQTKLLTALGSAKAAGNVYLEKRLEAGLPDLGAPKGARENIIKDYRDTIAIADLMYKARGPWEKLGSGRKGDVAGLVEFIVKRNDDSLVNNKGELDPKILKDLPEYIAEYKADKENPVTSLENKGVSDEEFNNTLNDENFIKFLQSQPPKAKLR